MPELPEVETVRAGLEKNVVGKKIIAVKQLHPRALRNDSLNKLNLFKNSKIKAVKRRGKFMWLEFDRPEVLVAHLGMSGQFKIPYFQIVQKCEVVFLPVQPQILSMSLGKINSPADFFCFWRSSNKKIAENNDENKNYAQKIFFDTFFILA